MLTVQDLIAKLQDSDPDAEVRISMLYGSKQECEVHPNIARVSVDERGHYGDHITVPIVYISAVRDLGMAPDEIPSEIRTIDTSDWSEDRLVALGELVHDQASDIASDTINNAAEVEFLLAHGWTEDEILKAVDEG